MSNYANTKAVVAANVYTNGNNEVTAAMVKAAINEVIDTLIAGGYLYKGVVIPTSPAITSDANIFVIATTAGTYTNFKNSSNVALEVADGEVAILKYNGSWSKEVTGAATAAQVSQLREKVGDLDVVVKGKWSDTFHISYTGTVVPVARILLKGGRPYTFTLDTQDVVTAVSFGLVNPADSSYIQGLSPFTSFPGSKTITPTEDYEEALLVIAINPSNTYIDLSVTIEAESLSTPIPFLNPAISKLFPVENKYIKPADGKEQNSTGYRATDFIEIDKTIDIKVYGLSGNVGKIVFYDEKKNFISSVSATYSQSPVICEIANIPATAKYIRCSSLVNAGFAPIVQCVSFLGFDNRIGVCDTKIENLESSGMKAMSMFVNQNLAKGATGWTKNSQTSIAGNVVTAIYNGTTIPYIAQTINMLDTKQYYVRAKGVVSNANALIKSTLKFTFGAARVFGIDVELQDDGPFDLEGIVRPDAGYGGSKLATLTFSYNNGTPAFSGLTSGDKLFDVTLDYFVVIEVPRYTGLTSSDVDAVGRNGEAFVYHPQLMKRSWCAIGDSITYQGVISGNGYVYYSANILGCSSVTNISAGGKAMSKPGSSGNPAMCDDAFLATIPDAWLVTFLGGTNDWGGSHPIGAVDSSDDTTYCGAINHIIDYFSQNKPLTRLVFICPTYGENYTWDTPSINQNGDTMWDYMEAVKKVCERRGIPYVEMGQKCGWNSKNIRTFVKDDGGLLHPNALGGRRMTSILVNSLKEILPCFDSWD